ncbi:hypothetical protein ACH7BS_24155 [Klebsiella aerogenes]|uniref:hypothetical protein n=1 Tax=Klebsiella aerogenes TaxID=548 RepID=UPI0037AE627E
MRNGFYWVETHEGVEIAWYSHEEVEDIETDEVHTGVWFVAGKPQTAYFSCEVTILQGPLFPPGHT